MLSSVAVLAAWATQGDGRTLVSVDTSRFGMLLPAVPPACHLVALPAALAVARPALRTRVRE